MKKILFCDYISINDDKSVSTLYMQKVNKIMNNTKFDSYDIGNDKLIDFNKYDTLLLGSRSIHLYKKFKGDQKRKIEEKLQKMMIIPNKYFWIQDMHPKTYGDINKLCEFLETNKINIIFTFFKNGEASIIRKLVPSVKHLYLPHHINTSIFNVNSNSEKIYDILLYGSIHPKHYPFRNRLSNLIRQHENKFKIKFIPEPTDFDENICEAGLATLISQSKIAIATKSRYDYFVAKYHEISACKCLVIGNMATDGLSVYEKNYINLDEKLTDEEIINTITNVLNNYDIYKPNIDIMYERITQEYNLDKYIEKLLNIIE